MTDVDVFFDTTLVGRLSVSEGIRPAVEFQYAPSWLGRKGTFDIDPALAVRTGGAPYRRGDSLFGAFRDSAPDEWGRGLLSRTLQRHLGEADYLLGVSDATRQGALRYRELDAGAWLTDESPVPVRMDLPRLQSAARDAEQGVGPPIRELAAAGGGTGGARPKVVIRDGGELWIAKFGRRDDLIDVEPAEFAVAQLAERAGVVMSETRLLAGDEPTLLTKRFDRVGQRRLGYLSALSLLEQEVGPSRGGVYDYLELADVLPTWSSQPDKDLAQLCRRIAFGALVRNTDDHMRNHAFIRTGDGWRLSPAFDVNPDVLPWTEFATSVDAHAGEGRLEALIETADYFRMSEAEALAVLSDVVDAVSGFDDVLAQVPMSEETRGELAKVFGSGVTLGRQVLGSAL